MAKVRIKDGNFFFVALVFVFLLFGFLTWSGQLPYGSDSDEHMLVAKTMLKTGQFSVGDIHGTKYPPVISALLILFSLAGSDMGFCMILANYFFLLCTGLLCFWFIGRQFDSRWLGAMAGIYVLSNIVLWQSVRLIIADTLFVLLVTIVLMMSLQLQQWKRRHVLYALIVVLFATSVRSVGAVLSVPVITAIWGNRKWKLNPFSFVSATLFICVPVVTLVLYTLYQKQFGAHPTGYLETFFLSDPYDISKGPLTWSGFLIRTYDHAFSSATDISTAILSILPTFGNIYIGAFYFISAAVILAAACRRSGLQAATVLSFMIPYSAIAVLWPYSGPRFAIPLIPVAAMGLAEIASSISKRFARAGRIGILILFLGYVGMNMIYMAGTAHLEKTKLAEIHRNDKDLTDWYLKHIPEDAVTASFDYREHTLRLNRSVLPLYYTSDMQAQVSYLTQHKVSVLILSDAGYYLRGVYGRSLLKTLGNNAELLFKNELFEVYRLKGVF